MFMVLKFLIILSIVATGLITICLTLSSKSKYDREKYSVFECGFDLMSALRLPFSLNFYFITIIFLIFDVELVMILPFVFNFNILTAWKVLGVMVIFCLILILGFIYEWTSGLLNWLV